MSSEGIPRWLPPSLALVCSISSGCTSFGDAILYQVLWAVFAAAGVVPNTRASLATATLFTAIESIANLPFMMWQSRREVPSALPYGSVLGLAGAASVPLGAQMLFFGDLYALKLCVGLFFFVFSVARLTPAIRARGKARAARRRGHARLGDNEPAAAGAVGGNSSSSGVASSSSSASTAMVSSGSISSSSSSSDAGASGGGGDGSGSVTIARTRSSGGGGRARIGSAASSSMASASPRLGGASAGSGSSSSGTGGGGGSLHPVLVDTDARGYGTTTSSSAGDGGGAAAMPAAELPVLTRGTSAAPAAGSSANLLAPSAPAAGGASGAHSVAASKGGSGEVLLPPAWVPARLRPYLTLHSITPTASIRAALLSLASTGLASGVLGAMFGTGGPPQMVAYALLHVHKDYLRALGGIYSCYELVSRVASYATTSATPFHADDWGMYVAAAVLAPCGFLAGSHVRRYTDTDAVIALLLVMVYTSSAILLGALQAAPVAAAFAAFSSLWAALLAALYLRPQWFTPCVDAVAAWRRSLRSSGGGGGGGAGANGGVTVIAVATAG